MSNSVDWIRERFHQLCGNESAGELWCITEGEAQELLNLCESHLGTVMEAIKNTGTFLRRVREKKMVYCSEDECIHILHEECRTLFSHGRAKLGGLAA